MRISKKDWAQLSAYLDGELNQRESKKIQQRIKGDPDFQAALEDLSTVKAVISHAPRLSVPRNFSLRRSLVESPRRPSPVRGYSLAAAVLSFLFIGVVVVDIGSGMLKGGLSAAQAPRAEEVMMESVADEMEEPVLLMKDGAVEEEVAPAAEMAEAPKESESLEAGMDGESAKMEEMDTNADQEDIDRASSGGEGELGEVDQEIENTPDPTEVADVEEAPSVSDQEPDGRNQIIDIPWMLILEVALGLGAVGLAVVAWMKRKKLKKS